MGQPEFDFEDQPAAPDEQSRMEQIVERMAVWLEASPAAWPTFCRFADEARASGQETFGAKAVAERMRWHAEIESHGEPFKICNSFIAYLARMYNAIHPELDPPFFTTRVCRSADRPAGPESYGIDRAPDPGEEDALLARLLEIVRKVEE